MASGERGPEHADTAGPLTGLRVVEYGDLVTAPYAAKLLRDLGASVLKIEPPGAGDRSRTVGPFPGDAPDPEKSGLFIYLNAGKRGITLDLESPTGQDLFADIIRNADVFIENVSPGDAKRLGLDCERVRGLNDGLIHLSITPFGHSGPYSSHTGYGINVTAMSGVLLGNGEPDRHPIAFPDFLEDFFTGVVGAMSCALALAGRGGAVEEDAPRGEWIDLSGAEAWMTYQTGLGVVGWLFGGARTVRQGRRHLGVPYPNTILRCKDGEVRVIAMTKREWIRFVEVMGTPEWTTDERFQDRLKMNELYADELDALIEPWLMERTKAELAQIFYDHSIPFTPLNDFTDVLQSPQLRAREFFVRAEQPGIAPLEVPGPPYRLLHGTLNDWCPAPRLGQHNEAMYEGELGMQPRDVVALRQAGVI